MSEHYPHKLAAVYPDEHTANAALQALGTAALNDVRVTALAPGDASAGKTVAPGNGLDRDTIARDLNEGAVEDTASWKMPDEAPVLFVSTPAVDPLIVLGYGAVIGKTVGAVYGIRLRERILAGLLRDSLKAGCHVVVLHASSCTAWQQAEAVIRSTLLVRPESG